MAEKVELSANRKHWLTLIEYFKNGKFKLPAGEYQPPIKFSWTNIPLGKINPLKSDDLKKVLLAESDVISYKSNAATFLNHYNLPDIQELLITASTHWILSYNDVKVPYNYLKGLSEDMNIEWDTDKILIFLPQESLNECCHLKIQEAHQIVRELVVGMFVFNQLPGISLEAAYDKSTICQLPVAYKNTTIGQSLIEVDYMLKCMWLGGFMAKEKRVEFNTKWKSLVEHRTTSRQSLLNNFIHEGLQDISEIPCYKEIYNDSLTYENKSSLINKNNQVVSLNFSINSWNQLRTMLLIDSGFNVTYTAPLDANEDVKVHLRELQSIINKHLLSNVDILQAVEKLKLVAALIPVLMFLKKHRKIPNLAYLRPPIAKQYCMTEGSLPPLTVGEHFTRNLFYEENKYYSLEGSIKFDFETPTKVENFPNDVIRAFRKRIISFVKSEDIKSHTTKGLINEQLLASFTVNSKRFHVLQITLENCLPKNCQKPYWTSAIHNELIWHKFKTLPKTDSQIEEQIKNHCGISKEEWQAMGLTDKLHAVTALGMTASFHALLREIHNNDINETFNTRNGWSLLHTAAKCNSVSIVTQMIQSGLDVNVKSMPTNELQSFGDTALHIAGQYGSLETLSCLLSFGGNLKETNSKGWAPIHISAFCDQLAVIVLLHRHCNSLHLPTSNKLKQLPLHLSSISGSLETIKWILDQYQIAGTNNAQNVTDANGSNFVHLATLHSQIHVLKYLISDRAEINVWHSMSEMLLSASDSWRIASVRCIRLLSEETFYLNSIVKAGMQTTLVGLLQDVAVIQPHVIATLSQMSSHHTVQQALRNPKLITVLVKFLSCKNDISASQAASILGDVVVDGNSKDVVGAKGGIGVFGELLVDSSKSTLVLNVIKAISSVCFEHVENQDRVSSTETVIPRLVHLLSIQSDAIRGTACTTLVTVARSHAVNQSHIIDCGGVKYIRYLLTIRNPKLQKKAAELLRELVMKNPINQTRLLEMDALKPTITMLKGSDVELQEVAAEAIWAMAGSGTAQRKLVAKQIGTNCLINMLLTKSQVLVCTSCLLVAAIVYENYEEQLKFLEEGGVKPLIRMIQDKDSPQSVLTAVLQTLSTLCLGTAYNGHAGIQNELDSQCVVQSLIQLSILNVDAVEIELQVVAIYIIACSVLRHKNNMKTLQNSALNFIENALKQFDHLDEEIRVMAGMSLALYILNYSKDLKRVRYPISLKYDFFEKLLNSNNESNQCLSAFQVNIESMNLYSI
ncbi:hypothetical protein CHUAL_003494 [Chamberlinius hualienensis]